MATRCRPLVLEVFRLGSPPVVAVIGVTAAYLWGPWSTTGATSYLPITIALCVVFVFEFLMIHGGAISAKFFPEQPWKLVGSLLTSFAVVTVTAATFIAILVNVRGA